MLIEEHALDDEACAEDDGGFEATDSKSVSPLQAARQHCLWCCDGSANEVRLCAAAATSCPLYPYRFGRRPTGEEVAAIACRNVLPFEEEITQWEFHAQGATALRAIKRRCLDCSGCSKAEVRNCKFTDCDLWSFREGKNPNRVLSGEALEAARANGARLAAKRVTSKIDGSTADPAA
jgi:hypothetical protein